MWWFVGIALYVLLVIGAAYAPINLDDLFTYGDDKE